MNTCKTPHRLKKMERGAELVEFAFILPVLLVIFAGIWDFGRAFRTYQAITNAAREGARFAVLPEGKNQETAIQNRVKAYLTRAGIDTTFINSGNVDTYVEVRTPRQQSYRHDPHCDAAWRHCTDRQSLQSPGPLSIPIPGFRSSGPIVGS